MMIYKKKCHNILNLFIITLIYLISSLTYSANTCYEIFSTGTTKIGTTRETTQKVDGASKRDPSKTEFKPVAIEQSDSSKTLSKLFRSNAKYYWNKSNNMIKSLMENEALLKALGITKEFLEELLKFTGRVRGDNHLGNTHKTFNFKTRKLEWKNIDLDDTFHDRPLLLDFIYNIISIKSIYKDLISKAEEKGKPDRIELIDEYSVKVKDLIQFYLDGLAFSLNLGNSKMKVPDSIKKVTDLSAEEYEARRFQYVSDHTKGDHFLIGKKDLKEYDQSMIGSSKEETLRTLHKAFKEENMIVEILDLAILPIESGGSATKNSTSASELGGGRRIWVLVKMEDKNHIFEVKELGIPGASYFDQADSISLKTIKENFNQARHHYGYDGIDLKLVDLNNIPYYLREKKITLYDIPYKAKSDEELQFLKDLSNWNAYLTGKMHAENKNAKDFYDFISQNHNVEMFRNLSKHISKIYLDELKNEIEN